MKVISTLPSDPEYLIPTDFITQRAKGEDSLAVIASMAYGPIVPPIGRYYKHRIDERVDDLLYWDENKNAIYVEALAKFSGTAKFVKFRKDIETKLHVDEIPCQMCGCKKWKARNVDVKTVTNKDGRRLKCLSIIFACSDCLANNRVSERSIRMQAWKYALKKFGRGVKDFFNRIRKIEVEGDLSKRSAKATLDFGDEQVKLERCPLL